MSRLLQTELIKLPINLFFLYIPVCAGCSSIVNPATHRYSNYFYFIITMSSNDSYPSTLPQPGHNWQVTLDGKVIASKLILPLNRKKCAY